MSLHFLDIPEKTARDASAPYVVLPVPYERTVSYGGGTLKGPEAILKASHETEDFDEELMIPLNPKVRTLPALELEGMSDAKAMNVIENSAKKIITKKRFLLSLGGEHTISFPLIKAVRALYKNICVLHIDAHLDLRSKYSGTPLSHACVMRRVREMKIRTVHAGIRSFSKEEHSYATENNVPIVSALDIAAQPPMLWISRFLHLIGRSKVYVSFDIDALDPSLVPGTGTPEPGGLTWHNALTLLRAVFKNHDVVAADIVETAPIPGTQVSEFTAARLGAKMLTYHQHRKIL